MGIERSTGGGGPGGGSRRQGQVESPGAGEGAPLMGTQAEQQKCVGVNGFLRKSMESMLPAEVAETP